jgi:hypothetical protein
MRSTLLVLALGSMMAVSGGGAVIAESIPGSATGVLGAPIGHLQPRPGQFSPLSAAEQAMQQKMSEFDAEQQKLDEELDRRLNICRC